MTRNHGRKKHKGVDYLCEPGDYIYAAHDGTIRLDGFQRDTNNKEENEGYGSRIWLDGKDGVQTRYAHLEMQIYKRGMFVKAGAMIGRVGKTGNAHDTPTHVHFEVRLSGEPVNPEWWLTGEGTRQGIEAHNIRET
jgi:murein DD-endopeptidase MepM/ murein hydrolase activator NlpD